MIQPVSMLGVALLVLVPQEPIPVGVPHWSREVVIEGSRLVARPANLDTQVIIRIESVSPHGKALRYDLEYYGLEPGHFNLLDFLQREDGSPVEGVAPITIHVQSHLAPGPVKPAPLDMGPSPDLGGYRLLMGCLGALWIAVSLAWLLHHRKKAAVATALTDTPPATIAERLAPLIQRGLKGELPTQDQARLELTLIAIWRQKLGLHELNAAEVLLALKAHEQAGPLLLELERWLHSPESSPRTDIEALLAPYEELDGADWEWAVQEVELSAGTGGQS